MTWCQRRPGWPLRFSTETLTQFFFFFFLQVPHPRRRTTEPLYKTTRQHIREPSEEKRRHHHPSYPFVYTSLIATKTERRSVHSPRAIRVKKVGNDDDDEDDDGKGRDIIFIISPSSPQL